MQVIETTRQTILNLERASAGGEEPTMTIRDARGIAASDPPEPAFWGQLFAGLPAPVIVADSPGRPSTPQSETFS